MCGKNLTKSFIHLWNICFFFLFKLKIIKYCYKFFIILLISKSQRTSQKNSASKRHTIALSDILGQKFSIVGLISFIVSQGWNNESWLVGCSSYTKPEYCMKWPITNTISIKSLLLEGVLSYYVSSG